MNDNDLDVMDIAKNNRLLILDCFDAAYTSLQYFKEGKQSSVSNAYEIYKVWDGNAYNQPNVMMGCALRENGTDNYIFAFRGTSTLKEFWTDIDYVTIPFMPYDSSDNGQNYLVARGFYHMYTSMRAEVFKTMLEIPKIDRLAVAGHSLGGAIAGLFTFDCLLGEYGATKSIYGSQFTFMVGMPRMVTSIVYDKYRSMLIEQGGQSINIANINDRVTQPASKSIFAQLPYLMTLNFLPDQDILERHNLVQYRGNFEKAVPSS